MSKRPPETRILRLNPSALTPTLEIRVVESNSPDYPDFVGGNKVSHDKLAPPSNGARPNTSEAESGTLESSVAAPPHIRDALPTMLTQGEHQTDGCEPGQTNTPNPTETHYLALARLETALRDEFFSGESTKPSAALIQIVGDTNVASGHYCRNTKWSRDEDEVFTIPIPRTSFTEPGQVCLRILQGLLNIAIGNETTYIAKGVAKKLYSFGVGVEKNEGSFWKAKVDIIPGGRLDTWMQENPGLFGFFRAVEQTHVEERPVTEKPKKASAASQLSDTRKELASTKDELESFRALAQQAGEAKERAEALVNTKRDKVSELEARVTELEAQLAAKDARIAELEARLNGEVPKKAEAPKVKGKRKAKPTVEVETRYRVRKRSDQEDFEGTRDEVKKHLWTFGQLNVTDDVFDTLPEYQNLRMVSQSWGLTALTE